jgi:hypothetical protein
VALVKLIVPHYLVRIFTPTFEERTRKIEAKCLHSPPSKATHAPTKAHSQAIVAKERKQRPPAPYWPIDFIIWIWASFIKCKQMIVMNISVMMEYVSYIEGVASNGVWFGWGSYNNQIVNV